MLVILVLYRSSRAGPAGHTANPHPTFGPLPQLAFALANNSIFNILVRLDLTNPHDTLPFLGLFFHKLACFQLSVTQHHLLSNIYEFLGILLYRE